MEDQPQKPPHHDEDRQEWNRTFARNNQRAQVLMAETLQLLEDLN